MPKTSTGNKRFSSLFCGAFTWKRLGLLLFSAALLLGPFKGSGRSAEWQAELATRVYSPKIPLIQSKARFYQKGAKIRIEPSDSEEYKLYDFEQGLVVRVFPRDQIYFEKPLSIASTIKAMKEAWIPAPPPFEERRILLRKGIFKGQKAALYFMIFTNRNERAYALRWLSDNEAESPLRIIYPGSARETIILDYRPVGGKKMPPGFLDPPAEYLSLNPF